MQCKIDNTEEYHRRMDELNKLIANGNPDAYKFIVAWLQYCHGIDDVVDGEIKDQEGIVSIFFTAAAIYNSNFWIANRDSLFILVALITNDYVDSNTPFMPQKDFLRSTGNNMLKAVAFITGGYPHLRKISGLLNHLAYEVHHDINTGEPK